MYEEGKAILGLLHKREFEAYYIGGKCRNELHNQFHPEDKIEVKDIDIVCNATVDKIQSIFPNSSVRGESFQVAAVKFGNYEFEVATYREDIYDMDTVSNSDKVVKPETKVAANLDIDRSRRDYSCNAVAETIDGEYIDYKFTYRNKKISAIQDIKDGIIRAIGNPKERIEEDPARILRAFSLVSQLGYTIEPQTLKAITKHISLIEKLPLERIAKEMNKIIMGKYAVKALKQMIEIGIFNLTACNSNKLLMNDLNNINEETFTVLDSLSMHKVHLNPIEVWTIILKQFGKEKAVENLLSIQALNNNDIEKVEWLIEHYDIVESEDKKNDLFNARTGIVKRMKLMCMKELINRLNKIYLLIHGKDYEKKCIALRDAFCSRPYFHEQLKVTGEQMIEISGEKPGPWINTAKEKLLFKLINTDKFPKEDEKYMELVTEAVEEAIFEEEMKSKGLI